MRFSWRASLSLCTLAFLLVSLADRSHTVWFAARALAFLVCLVLARTDRPAFLYTLAAAFAAIAAAGFNGFDFALACLAFSSLNPKLRHLARLCASIASLATLSLLYTYFEPDWTPVFFPFHNRNHYAVFCEFSLPVLVYTWRRSRGNLYLYIAAMMLLGALAGGSRVGALLLLLEARALAAAVLGREKLLFAAPATAIAASLFLLLDGGARITDPFVGDHRFEIWRSSLQMLAARPLAGWGAGDFPRIYPAFALFDNGQFVNAVHSDWLEWAVEFGLPSTLGFLAIFLWWIRKSIHFYPSWGILISALHATVDFPFHLPAFLVFAAALAGSIQAYGPSIEAESTDRQRRNP